MTKVMERTAGIRFTDYRDHPIDISLRIYPRERDYWQMAIKALGQTRDKMFIDITTTYLGELNARLRQAAGLVLHHAKTEGSDEEQWRTDLAALAEAGNFVFHEIFKDKALKTIQDLFDNAEKFAKNITIEVDSEHFFIPWELLYSKSPENPQYEDFWGMKYIISRVIVEDDRPGNIEPTTIYVDSKPKLGLLAFESPDLPSIGTKEIPFFQTLKNSGQIDLRRLPDLDPTPPNKKSELTRFKEFFSSPLDVAHFACHAYYDEEKSLESFIQLSKGIRISLYDLGAKPPVAISDFPLVVLNACKMGQMKSMDVHYFARDFIRYGALGVIATEAAVPDALAAEFTQHLYGHLLSEKFLGESMLLTRQELLKSGNPVGLVYALYAPAIIRLQLPKPEPDAPGSPKADDEV